MEQSKNESVWKLRKALDKLVWIGAELGEKYQQAHPISYEEFKKQQPELFTERATLVEQIINQYKLAIGLPIPDEIQAS